MTRSIEDKLNQIGRLVRKMEDASHVDVITGLKYNVSIKDRMDLYRQYKIANQGNEVIGVSEVFDLVSHFVFRFDLSSCDNRAKISKDEIRDLAMEIYNTLIVNLMIVQEANDLSKCCIILNKEELYIHFPNIYNYCDDTNYKIVNLIKRNINDEKWNTDWYKYIDDNIYKDRMLPMHRTPYDESPLFLDAQSGESVKPEKMFDRIIDGLSDKNIIDYNSDGGLNIDHTIGILLSIHIYCDDKDKMIIDKGDPVQESIIKYNLKTFDKRNAPEVDKSLEHNIRPSDLLDMWKCTRIENYSEWKRIGEALFNYYNGDTIGIKRWIEETDAIVDRLVRDGGKNQNIYMVI